MCSGRENIVIPPCSPSLPLLNLPLSYLVSLSSSPLSPSSQFTSFSHLSHSLSSFSLPPSLSHSRKLWCSHAFTWTFCSIYVAGSVASLWACPPYTSYVTLNFHFHYEFHGLTFDPRCTDASICVISHFMCTFGPIVVFMVALPIFYISAWKQSKFNSLGL